MKKSREIENILFITLTNIGDAILTTAALGALLKEFPEAKITVITSPAAANLFEGNPAFSKVVVYDKHSNFRRKIQFFLGLRGEKFDLIVDLKNMLMTSFLSARYRIALKGKGGERNYKKDIFLLQLKSMFEKKLSRKLDVANAPFYIWTSKEDEANAAGLIERCRGAKEIKMVAISPFAKSDTKSWPQKNFAELIKRLKTKGDVGMILVGSKQDGKNADELIENIGGGVCNLCGKTSLRELAEVLKSCKCLISNDSAAMHLASGVGTPVAAIFGPTDTKKYAPTGKQHKILTAGLDCQPCEKAQCVFGKKPADCLEYVTVDKVMSKIGEMLGE